MVQNPIHRDMEAAAALARLQYIVNVVIDEEKKTVAAFAGEFRQAHAAGVAFLRRYCETAPVFGDVVVTTNGGAPLDQNLYQCVKGLTAAEATANPGAAIILCAEMADGIGGAQFYQDMKACASPAQLYAAFASRPQAQTVPDQWQTQILCRVLMKHRVIFVTRPEMQAGHRGYEAGIRPRSADRPGHGRRRLAHIHPRRRQRLHPPAAQMIKNNEKDLENIVFKVFSLARKERFEL